MPRFFLKTVSILTLAALTACSGPLDRSDSSTENLHAHQAQHCLLLPC